MATLHCNKMAPLKLKERKTNLFQLVKNMVNAGSETAFYQAFDSFTKLAGNATVTTPQKTVVAIQQYFEDNWLVCKEMWSRAYRRHLPLAFTYTTNRVERFFEVLKAEMKIFFVKRTPSAVEFIPFLVDFLKRKHTSMSLQSVRRYSPNDSFKHILQEASMVIAGFGCKLFHKSLKAASSSMLQVAEPTGVSEQFSQGEEKTYATTPNSCNCNYRFQYATPCTTYFISNENCF